MAEKHVKVSRANHTAGDASVGSPYEPPAIEWLGSWETLTASIVGSGPDVMLLASSSDRARKERVEPVNAEEVLAALARLPVRSWSYAGQTTRHIGPMAQDFAASFRVGDDDRLIHHIDATGVALAAIQALQTRLHQVETELSALHSTVVTGRPPADPAPARA